jgi:hypothetical protein
MKCWRKHLEKESEESLPRVEIVFENEDSIEFQKADDTWYGYCTFWTDDFDCNNLEEIKDVIDSLNMIKSLKEENSAIHIESDVDRGIMYFDITIPDSIMSKIEEV